MAKVMIPTPLRQFTAKQDSVTVPGATVGEVLAALTTEFPDLRKQIFNDEGRLRSFVRTSSAFPTPSKSRTTRSLIALTFQARVGPIG